MAFANVKPFFTFSLKIEGVENMKLSCITINETQGIIYVLEKDYGLLLINPEGYLFKTFKIDALFITFDVVTHRLYIVKKHDPKVVAWDQCLNEKIFQLNSPPTSKAYLHEPTMLKCDSRGQIFVYDAKDQNIKIYDHSTGSLLKTLEHFLTDHRAQFAFGFHLNEVVILECFHNCLTFKDGTGNISRLLPLKFPHNKPIKVSISTDGKIAIAFEQDTLFLYDTNKDQLIPRTDAHNVSDITWDESGGLWIIQNNNRIQSLQYIS